MKKSVTSKLTLSTTRGTLNTKDSDAWQTMLEEFKPKALKLLAKYSDCDAQWQATIKLRTIGDKPIDGA
jgi:hypothetical protein